jgi:hypothetical protein
MATRKQTTVEKTTSQFYEFKLVDNFNYGYRNREDITNLPPGVLIPGSQNVLTDVTGRVGIAKGYVLDGAAGTDNAGIRSAFDWQMHTGAVRHLRAGFKAGAADGKLQYRYVAPNGTVTWRDLMTSLTSVNFNFCDFWNATNQQAYLLFVNGASSIYEWSGGITTFASDTANTITKQGTTTFAEEGFYDTGTHSITINGVDYAATGGWGTTTLTGVTPDPTGNVIAAGDVIHQKVTTVANSAITALPDTLANDLIANLRNQIYIGSLTNNSVFISKVNNYLDFGFTSPVRLVGEGALVTMDGPARALIPQEDYMAMFAALDQIYQTVFQLSADLTSESFEIHRLKTSGLQGTQSQALTGKIKNNVVFVSNEPIISTLGRVDNVVLTPQISDISFPIVNDMNSYDFTDGGITFWKNYLLIAVPREGLVRIYNMTKDASTANPIAGTTIHYWEAPLTIPLSCFSIIDGDLYGHSYQVSETYKLFTGYNFNGGPIPAVANFSYQQFGARAESKSHNEFYLEGYITPSTTLTTLLSYEYGGFGGTQTIELNGDETPYVFIPPTAGSLGKTPLGKEPLAADLDVLTTFNKFRIIFTLPRIPYYEFSPSFSSIGADFNWSIIAFGPATSLTTEGNFPIKR